MAIDYKLRKTLAQYAFLMGAILISIGVFIDSDGMAIEDYWNYYIVDYHGKLSSLEAKYGVEITLENPMAEGIEGWEQSPLMQHTEAVSDFGLSRLVAILESTLKPYPPELVKSNIEVISLHGHMQNGNGVALASAWVPKRLYLSSGDVKGGAAGYRKESIEEELYFSLYQMFEWQRPGMRYFPPPPGSWDARWRASIPPGHEFFCDQFGDQVCSHKLPYGDANDVLLAQGFLTNWGSESGAADQYSYVVAVLQKPDHLGRLVRKYPAIKLKYELIKESYMELHPGFAAAFAKVE